MNRIIGFIIFLTVAFSIYSGMHYYVYSQIVKGLDLSNFQIYILRATLIIGAFSYFGATAIDRRFHHSFALLPASIWMGVISIAFSTVLIKHLATLGMPAYNRELTILALIAIPVLSGIALIDMVLQPMMATAFGSDLSTAFDL